MKNDTPLGGHRPQEVAHHRCLPRVHGHHRRGLEDARQDLRDRQQPCSSRCRPTARASTPCRPARRSRARTRTSSSRRTSPSWSPTDRRRPRAGRARPTRPSSRSQRPSCCRSRAEDPDAAARAADRQHLGRGVHRVRAHAAAAEHRRERLDRRPRADADRPDRPKPTLYTLLAAISASALGLGRRVRCATASTTACARPRTSRRSSTARCWRASPRRGRSDTRSPPSASRSDRCAPTFSSRARTRQTRAIAITSGRQDEGKTTTVTQLALASAEVGQRVIVVEADFRRPRAAARADARPRGAAAARASATTSSRRRRSTR